MTQVSDHERLQLAAHEHLLMHFTRNGAFGPGATELVVLDRGEGPYVFDTRGRRYLDALSSMYCCQIGYSYGEEMASVASAQLARLPFNTNWSTAHPAAIELATRVAELAPGDLSHVLFTSGGSEAVEAAWKVVRHYHLANGEPQRLRVIARQTAYHGVTMGALAFTGVPRIKEPFGAPAIPVTHVANTNAFRGSETDDELCDRLLGEIEAAMVEHGPDSVAMVIAEPVQNAGGCLVPPVNYWPRLRQLCDRYGVLLVADEVITAFGRLGEWFGVTRYDATPDLITVAKGLTSAYAPMGALIVSERVAAPLFDEATTFLHGMTFGGHPLAAAIALRNLEIFERDQLLEHVRANEAYFAAGIDELREIPIVGDSRGAGFFRALELVRGATNERFDAAEREELVRRFLPQRLVEAGLIVRCDDRGDAVVQVAPPLICGRDVLDELVAKLAEVLEDASAHMGLEATAGIV
jgi:adenosylmethionine-8-amino-7-oxononanoate aminotransferase